MPDKRVDPRRQRRLRRRGAAVAGVGLLAVVVMVLGSLRRGSGAEDAASAPGYRGKERVLDTTPFTMVPSDGDSPVTLPDEALIPGGSTTVPTTTAPPATTTTLPPFPTDPLADPLCEAVRRIGLASIQNRDRSVPDAANRLLILQELQPVSGLLAQAADPRLEVLPTMWTEAYAEASASSSLSGVAAAVSDLIKEYGTQAEVSTVFSHLSADCPQIGSFIVASTN